MNRGLVVVTPTDGGRELLRQAGEYAAGADAELVLLAVTPQEAYSETRAAVAAVGSPDAVHSLNQAEGSAERQARRLAREAFAELDVSYDVVAAVGDESDRIFEVAAERDCDHLFLAGRRRSPTGKALFGDRTQRALLNFDGPVTVILGGEE